MAYGRVPDDLRLSCCGRPGTTPATASSWRPGGPADPALILISGFAARRYNDLNIADPARGSDDPVRRPRDRLARRDGRPGRSSCSTANPTRTSTSVWCATARASTLTSCDGSPWTCRLRPRAEREPVRRSGRARSVRQARAAASPGCPCGCGCSSARARPSCTACAGRRCATPDRDAPLLTGEHLLFSRYLSSCDWRPVKLRPKGDLRALVVVANPTDLGSYQPVAGRWRRSTWPASWSGHGPAWHRSASTALARAASATLDNLVDRSLREGYDILYLVCHGAWSRASRGSGWRTRPAASARVPAQRAGRAAARAAPAPAAGRAGLVPERRHRRRPAQATMAARWRRSARAWPRPASRRCWPCRATSRCRRWRAFMPVFFRELQRDGQIDRAMAVARGAVREPARLPGCRCCSCA